MFQERLVYPYESKAVTTPTIELDINQVMFQCECTGNEVASYIDEDKIPSFSVPFKSPVHFYWRYPSSDGEKFFASDSEVRKWAREACEYHKIPYILLALILQNENNPNAPKWRQVAQLAERTITTLSHIIERRLIDLPDDITKGSSGIANVGDQALRDGVSSSYKNYCRPVIPTSIKTTSTGWNTDTRISGDDWRNDMYYAAAHLRYLIDRELRMCFNGSMSDQQMRLIIENYNGSGPAAAEYARVAMANLGMAKKGEGVLYFYEK